MNIIIGNMISLIAGILLIVSLCMNDNRNVYRFQIYNALVMIVASFFFQSPVGMGIFLLIALRLSLVYMNRFTLIWTIVFLIVSVCIGLWVNTLGWIGLIPVIATIEITICNYAYKDVRWVKLSFLVNAAIYVPYFFLVYDFVSTTVQIITVVMGCISYLKLVRNRNAQEVRA